MMPRYALIRPWLWLCLLLAALAAVGCSRGGNPPILVRQWALDYPPPQAGAEPPLAAELQVKRFAAVQSFSSNSMVYRPSQYERAVYNYNRWRMAPADMLCDMMIRDLRAAGGFAAVFSYRQQARARFVLEGGLEEFLEVDEASGAWQAQIVLGLTLIDTSQQSLPQRIVFQRTLRTSRDMPSKNAAGLAKAMSLAAQELSQQAAALMRASAAEALKQSP